MKEQVIKNWYMLPALLVMLPINVLIALIIWNTSPVKGESQVLYILLAVGASAGLLASLRIIGEDPYLSSGLCS